MLLTILIGAISSVFIPYTAPSVLWMITLRTGLVITLSSLGSHPFVNDYVKKTTRGRAVSYQSAGYFVGDMFTFLFMLKITEDMTPENRFLTFGISLSLIGILFFALIKEPKRDIAQSDIQEGNNQGLFQNILSITK